MNDVTQVGFIYGEVDVKGGLDSIKGSMLPIVRELIMFIGWGGGIICVFVLLGLFIMIVVKKRDHRVIQPESITQIGVVLIVMVVLSAVGVWSTFFLR